jgi:hypothetical protein
MECCEAIHSRYDGFGAPLGRDRRLLGCHSHVAATTTVPSGKQLLTANMLLNVSKLGHNLVVLETPIGDVEG